MTTDHKELRRLAEAATKGTWYQSGPPWFNVGSGILAGSPDPHVAPMFIDCETWEGERDEWNKNNEGKIQLASADADAAFIVAAQPQTVIALLDEIDALKAGGGETDCFICGGDGHISGENDEIIECKNCEGTGKSPSQSVKPQEVRVEDVVHALEGQSGNTDTDPRWQAASLLKSLDCWRSRILPIRAAESAGVECVKPDEFYSRLKNAGFGGFANSEIYRAIIESGLKIKEEKK